MILKSTHIAKSFGRRKVLKDITFEIDHGSLNGIVGENGAGKSTLLKIIVGHWRPTKGLMEVNGKIGYCPQQPLLFPQLTVLENFKYFASAYQITDKEYPGRVDQLMEKFNFAKYQHDMVAKLSGGTQQKLNLALALIHDPELLVLDEPYNGFDWDTYLRFWDYIEDQTDKSCAVLIVTHLISETDRFDKIFEMKEGVFT